MAKSNVKTRTKEVKARKAKAAVAMPIFTAGGSKATPAPDAKAQLERTVMTCLLWENNFYEGGNSVAQRIADLVPQVHPTDVVDIATRAKFDMKLRHAPLFMIRELSRYTTGNLAKTKFKYKYAKENVGALVEGALAKLVRRADELAEFLSMYWREKKQPISAAVKRGLAAAFTKFDEYALAKWDRENDIRLRDVLFLTHAKPKDRKQEKLWTKLVEKTLDVPDTWEVALSAGGDKKVVFERMLRDETLGGMALLKNLRNMQQAGVNEKLVRDRLEQGVGIALPFNFITAAKHAPQYSDSIEIAMLKAIEDMQKLPGNTLLVVDISGSMKQRISMKSEVERMDAAVAMAMLARGLCERSTIFLTAGSDGARKHATMELPRHLKGLALAQAVDVDLYRKLGGGGIFLVQCMKFIEENTKGQHFDRVIVFTDEQDCDHKANPKSAAKLSDRNYIVNIGNDKNGISYQDGWHHIDGWSERTFDYIRVFEQSDNLQ